MLTRVRIEHKRGAQEVLFTVHAWLMLHSHTLHYYLAQHYFEIKLPLPTKSSNHYKQAQRPRNRTRQNSKIHIIHPPFLELPTSLTPNLTLLFSPLPIPPSRVDQDSTIHSYQTFLLSVARNMETVSVDASGM